MRRGMVIDLENCIGCRSCMVACKQHNAQPPGNWWNRVFTPGSERHLSPPEDGQEYFLPVHCQNIFLKGVPAHAPGFKRQTGKDRSSNQGQERVQ